MPTKNQALAALQQFSVKHGKSAALDLMTRLAGVNALSKFPPNRYAELIAATKERPMGLMRTALREYKALSSEDAVRELIKSIAGKTWIGEDDAESIRKITAAVNAANVSVFATERRLRMERHSAVRVAG